METTMVTIPLDQETARLYYKASEQDRRKLQLLMRLLLKDFIVSPRPLKVVMDEIGRNAQERGLTPEILQDLLKDE